MKRLLLTSAAVALLAAGSAMAADMSVPFKAAPMAVAPVYNWTGCYIGIHGGGAAFKDNLAATWSDGGIVGGQVGCNYQIDHLVIGVEGEGAWSGVESTANTAFVGGVGSTGVTFKNTWDADVAVRFGLAYDRFFIYEKLGASWGDHQFSVSTPGAGGFTLNGTSTLPGLLWGLGMEYGLTAQWTAKVETDFIHYAATGMNLSCGPVVNCGGTANLVSANSWAVVSKVGLNYRW
jgi:outer membrane immunogenic protein